MLVGNKTDKADRKIQFEEGLALAQTIGAKYIECSALNGAGVTTLFNQLFEESVNFMLKEESSKSVDIVIEKPIEEQVAQKILQSV